MRPRELAVLGDPIDGVKAALEKPIGCPPLKEAVTSSDHVALLITDTMDSLMGPPHNIGPYLLDQFNAAGVPDAHITVIHAAGMHGHAGAKEKLGEDWLHRVSYVEHHPYKTEDLAYVGTTQMGTPVWVNRAGCRSRLCVGRRGMFSFAFWVARWSGHRSAGRVWTRHYSTQPHLIS